MNSTSTLSVVLLVSAIFAGSLLHAHAARAVESSDAVSTSQADGDDGAAAHPGYWQIWAAATAQ